MSPKRFVMTGFAALTLLGVAGCLPALVLSVQGTTPLDFVLRAMLNGAGVRPIEKPAVDAAKVKLGQALFFDKILSGNRNISCATCHHPAAFTGDGLPVSIGQGGSGLAQSRTPPTDASGEMVFIPRNAPDIFNRAGFDRMFWDARVAKDPNGALTTPAGDDLLPGLESALAAQAMFPVTSRDEMRGHPGENELADIDDDDFQGMWKALMDRLLAIDEYRQLFAAAYPDTDPNQLTFAHAANAIAAFETEHWTLPDSPFDQYLAGDDAALSTQAKRGAILFYGKAGCARCHSGPLMTDQKFHNRVVPQVGPGKGDGDDGTWDFGRARVTGDPADRFKFRTPPLRNVAATGPYMHDGAFSTLEAAVRHCLDPATSAQNYDPAEHLPPELRPLYRANQTATILAAADPDEIAPVELTEAEIADLLAFLESLTSPGIGSLGIHDIPDSVPSGLPLAD